jgi:hypothetical protein
MKTDNEQACSDCSPQMVLDDLTDSSLCIEAVKSLSAQNDEKYANK